VAILTLADAATNTWAMNSNLAVQAGGAIRVGAGDKSLSGELTTVRITTDSADTFDVGSVSVQYANPTITGARGPRGFGRVVQTQEYSNTAVSTGTTVIPVDDTIPQITEGDEYMTLAITPADAANLLKIEVSAMIGHASASTFVSMALFKDADAGALAAALMRTESGSWGAQTTPLTHWIVAGDTNSQTFRIRCGGTAGTMTFNGRNGARLFGGIDTSVITITEYAPN
jgi:hypothetical protein